MKEILKNHNNGFYIPLTGQCYPIKSNEHIYKFLYENRNLNFIEILKNLTDRWSKEEIIERTKLFRFNYSSERGFGYFLYKINNYETFIHHFRCLYWKRINLSQFIDTFFARNIDLKIHGGNSMFSLNLETLQKLYSYIQTHKNKLFSHFKYSHCADELFFHTIIMEMMKNDKSIHIKPYDTVFIDWEEFDDSSKMCFTKKHFDKLTSLPDYELTARKFDTDIDSDILDMLDNFIDYNMK